MFENPGQKLKSFSKVLFWLSILGAIILAFAFGIGEEEVGYYYTYTETVFHGGIFFGILISGCLFSYVECLCLYGFGELIENSAKSLIVKDTPTTLQDIENNLPKL